jgi:hypothetical protein
MNVKFYAYLLIKSSIFEISTPLVGGGIGGCTAVQLGPVIVPKLQPVVCGGLPFFRETIISVGAKQPFKIKVYRPTSKFVLKPVNLNSLSTVGCRLMQGSFGGVITWQGLFVVEKQSTTRLDGTGQSWNASCCATSLPEGILLGLVKVKS